MQPQLRALVTKIHNGLKDVKKFALKVGIGKVAEHLYLKDAASLHMANEIHYKRTLAVFAAGRIIVAPEDKKDSKEADAVFDSIVNKTKIDVPKSIISELALIKDSGVSAAGAAGAASFATPAKKKKKKVRVGLEPEEDGK